jgi:hypothetical protein
MSPTSYRAAPPRTYQYTSVDRQGQWALCPNNAIRRRVDDGRICDAPFRMGAMPLVCVVGIYVKVLCGASLDTSFTGTFHWKSRL